MSLQVCGPGMEENSAQQRCAVVPRLVDSKGLEVCCVAGEMGKPQGRKITLSN